MISKAINSSLFTYSIRDTRNLGSELIESELYVLVATVDLCDILYAACTVGTHRCNEQGNTGTDIRTCHSAGTESDLMVVAHHHSTVRVAENNLCTHIDELVDEEQSALEHLLMEEHAATCLCRHNEENRRGGRG